MQTWDDVRASCACQDQAEKTIARESIEEIVIQWQVRGACVEEYELYVKLTVCAEYLEKKWCAMKVDIST